MIAVQRGVIVRNMTNLSDLELLNAMERGDGTALEELYERYVSITYSFALRITEDPSLSQEIVQDIFMKIWTSPRLYHPERGKFSSWLLALTRNASIDGLRKKARQNRFALTPSIDLHALPDENQNFLGNLEQEELREAIQTSLRTLKQEQIELLQLIYWQGNTLSEIAQQKDLPLGTVKSRLHTILKTLKSKLNWETKT
ncbi:sigma-70 family RNA polymerase sigma factor [Fodinisporobacter ferrooxydans]|uniref:Sigma-70 family RNA polymerase sigma factor n=1 Tax=Fodinisporobacter ferrooxydans TaxID=2901836 RepID=A0ABY4CG68_9BACL|nr:sigma-70 family RNA polymerase sigma factor [Alicyclobacillaceae bacterium MYW30-H2]